MSRITRNLGLILAVALFVFAAIRPVRKAAAFEEARAALVADIEALRVAAERRVAEYDAWPTESAPGAIPPEVVAAFPGDSSLSGDGYTVEWSVLGFVTTVEQREPTDLPAEAVGVIDSLPAMLVSTVRPSGLINVRASDPRILGALLDDYREEGAFVRDSVWSLVLPPPN